MLQVIDSAETTFERSDIIARCSEMSAYLGESRAQYYLVIEGHPTRHWSRRKVDFQTVLERANKVLEKIQTGA